MTRACSTFTVPDASAGGGGGVVVQGVGEPDLPAGLPDRQLQPGGQPGRGGGGAGLGRQAAAVQLGDQPQRRGVRGGQVPVAGLDRGQQVGVAPAPVLDVAQRLQPVAQPREGGRAGRLARGQRGD